jgi:hypothetical protein
MKDELNIVKYNLRIPKYLYDKLALKAEESRRSVNNEIIMAIASHVATARYDSRYSLDDLYELVKGVLMEVRGRPPEAKPEGGLPGKP